MSLVIGHPLALTTTQNTRQKRREQIRRLPLAHIMKLSGYQCFTEASVQEHKARERKFWLAWRAQQIVGSPTMTMTCLLGAICIAIGIVGITFGCPLYLAATLSIVSICLFYGIERGAYRKKLAQQTELLYTDPRYIWKTIPYEEYLRLQEKLPLPCVPQEARTMVQVVTSRLPGTKATVEYFLGDPILRFEFERSHERYPAFLWN